MLISILRCRGIQINDFLRISIDLFFFRAFLIILFSKGVYSILINLSNQIRVFHGWQRLIRFDLLPYEFDLTGYLITFLLQFLDHIYNFDLKLLSLRRDFFILDFIVWLIFVLILVHIHVHVSVILLHGVHHELIEHIWELRHHFLLVICVHRHIQSWAWRHHRLVPIKHPILFILHFGIASLFPDEIVHILRWFLILIDIVKIHLVLILLSWNCIG